MRHSKLRFSARKVTVEESRIAKNRSTSMPKRQDQQLPAFWNIFQTALMATKEKELPAQIKVKVAPVPGTGLPGRGTEIWQ